MHECLETANTWQFQIEQPKIRKAVLKPIQQRFTGFMSHRVTSLPAQSFQNDFTNHLLFVGHNDGARIESPDTRWNSWAIGSQMLAMVLIPTLLVRWISPRCRSIMFLQIAIPNPVPCGFPEVKNDPKTVGSSSKHMPVPACVT